MIVVPCGSSYDDPRSMIHYATIVCVAFAATSSLCAYSSMLQAERLDQKLPQLRRMMLQHVVCLIAWIVAVFVWWRGEEMHALRAQALEAATSSFHSGVVDVIGKGLLLSAGVAAILLLTLLPCIHVVRAMHDFVLDATQRRVAEEQVAAEGSARKV